MKKCPYCAEEVQDEAVVCKHCKSSLLNSQIEDLKNSNHKNNKSLTGEKMLLKILKVVGIIILSIIAIALWYITLPAIIIWYLWKKTNIERKKKIIYSGVTLAIFFIAWVGFTHINRAPQINIIEPANDSTVQVKSINIKGKLDPTTSTAKINGVVITVDKDGSFNYNVDLKGEKNTITVEANNGGNSIAKSLVINRIFTDEEKAEIAKQQAETKTKIDEKQKNELRQEIEDLNKLKSSTGQEDNLDVILFRASAFSAYKSMIDRAKSSNNSEIKQLGQQLEGKVIQLQTREFPLLRKAYGKVIGNSLWENNVDVKVYGTANKTIELVAGMFASNKNIGQTQVSIEEVLKKMRFNKVIYRWYEYGDGSGYDLESPKDSEIMPPSY